MHVASSGYNECLAYELIKAHNEWLALIIDVVFFVLVLYLLENCALRTSADFEKKF